MLPDARELFEFVNRDLMIRRIAGLLLLIQNRRAGDLSPCCGVNAARIFFIAPPEHLVEPVHAPIAQLAVTVIEKLPPTAGMDARIEWPYRRRAAPHVPIHSFRRFAVRTRSLAPAAA